MQLSLKAAANTFFTGVEIAPVKPARGEDGGGGGGGGGGIISNSLPFKREEIRRR